MIPIERQQKLIEYLRREPGLSVPDLAIRLQVSPGTVRNDLRALAEAGQVVRVRGGGTVIPEPAPFSGQNFAIRAGENEAAKRAIGRVAAELVEDGDSILLDASTSAYHLAYFLQNRRSLRVVTNGIEVARLLSQNPTHMVMLVGGTLRSGTQSVTGPWSLRFLDEVCTRYAFVSCTGFTPEGSMTEVDMYEAEFRIKAIGSANQVIALIDASKFGKTDLTPSVRIDRLAHIYTDSTLSADWRARLDRTGVPYTLCEVSHVS
jgi:DeoR/GlpR family transcriptional regulator of sugar metabolism